MEQQEANGLLGVTFTAEEHEAVRQWVQGKAGGREIVASETRLYLPVALTGMAAVDPGDTIWWDAEGGENAFSLERA